MSIGSSPPFLLNYPEVIYWLIGGQRSEPRYPPSCNGTLPNNGCALQFPRQKALTHTRALRVTMMIFPPSYCPLEANSQEEQVEELPIDTDIFTEEEIQEHADGLSDEDEEEGFPDGAPRQHHRYCALMVLLALALVFGIVMMVLVGPNILTRAKGVSGTLAEHWHALGFLCI